MKTIARTILTRTILTGTILTGLLLALFAVQAPAASTKMTATEITKEIVGKKLGYSGAFSGNLLYARNGKFNYTAKGKAFKGTWRFKRNRMCTILNNKFRKGIESCFDWVRVKPGRYRTSLGYKVWRR